MFFLSYSYFFLTYTANYFSPDYELFFTSSTQRVIVFFFFFPLALRIIFRGVDIYSLRFYELIFNMLRIHFWSYDTLRAWPKCWLRHGETLSEKEMKGVLTIFLQNLEGLVSLSSRDEVFWTEDLIEGTTLRLKDP